MRVTVKYGSGNELVREFPDSTTFGAVRSAAGPALGAGSNTQCYVSGVPQDDTDRIYDGMTISLHDRASTKAA